MNRASRHLVLCVLCVLVIALFGVGLWTVLSFETGIDVQRDATVLRPDDGGTGDDTPDVVAPARPSRYGEPGSLTGEVRRRADESPVAGQTVVLRPDGDAPREVVTDENGVFEIAGLARGERHTVELRVEGFAPVVVPGLRLGRHRRLDVGTLWLAAAAYAVVRVRASDGRWLPDVNVEAYRVGRGAARFEAGESPTSVASMRTDASGTADFSALSAGDWAFVAWSRGHERRSTGTVTLHGGAGRQQFLVTVGTGRTLTGRVLTRRGKPLASVEVVALRRTLVADTKTAPLAVRGWTNAHGVYELDGLPTGDVVLWAARPGWPLWVAAAVRLPGVETLDVVLPDPSRLVGRVVEGDEDEPVGGVPVEVSFRLPLGIWVTARDETDDRGAFALSFPGAGTVGEIVVERPGSFAAVTERGTADVDQRVEDGETIERDVRLVAGTRLTGHVLADGTGVRGARVVATHEHETREAFTDRTGRYEFSALRPGSVQVRVRRWGFAQADGLEVRIPPPDVAPRVEHDVTLTAGASVGGRVTDFSGNPLADAEVCVVGEKDAWCARTDAAGMYELQRVTPNRDITLVAEKAGFSPGFARVQNVPSVDIRLRPLLRVRGRVHGPAGAELLDAVVQAAGTSGDLHPIQAEWGWLQMDRMSVEPDGTFDHLVAITDGTFRVRAYAPGFPPAVTRPIAVEHDRVVYDVDVYLEAGGAVTGRVVDDDGTPVSGAWMSIVGLRDGDDLDAVNYPGAWGPPIAARTDEHGRFSVRGVARGRHALSVRSHGHRPASQIVEAPDSGVVIVALRREFVLGVVRDADGRAVLHATVEVADEALGHPVRTSTSDDGRFRIESRSGGALPLRITAPGEGAESVLVVLSPLADGEEHEVRIEVPER